MAEAGEEAAVLLLRALPAEVAEAILGKLGPAAGRLRARLQTPPAEPTPPNELDAALAQFFDLQRIAERQKNAAGGYGPAAGPATPETPANPVDELRAMEPDKLARALDGEQSGAVALVMSCLDPVAAGQVMKRLPGDVRAEVAVRVSKLGPRNPALLQQIARAVAAKGRRLADIPPEPTREEIVTNLADMIRALARPERTPVIQKLQDADAALAAQVLEKLYRIEDLTRIPDRQLQGLLAELDVKTIAVALKGVPPAVRGKVTSNMSSRSRAVLDEESELLGDVPGSRVREAQAEVLALVRKAEDEGKVTIEE